MYRSGTATAARTLALLRAQRAGLQNRGLIRRVFIVKDRSAVF